MSEQLKDSADEQLIDEQLALQFVDRELPRAQASLAIAERSLESQLSPFSRSYQPSYPGPRPHQEAGGMDHEDWEVANYEYNNYSYEDDLDEAENDVYHWERTVDELTDDTEAIKAGDRHTIARVAARERARLEKERKEAEQRQMRSGKELPLVSEMYSEVASIMDTITNAKLKPGDEIGPNGWRFAGIGSERDKYKGTVGYGYIFTRNPGQGPFEAYTDRLTIAGKTYAPADVTDGALVEHFELPAAMQSKTTHWDNVLFTDGEVSSYELYINEQGNVRQSEFRRGIAMDDRRPKNFIYEEGETGITTLHLKRADYKGDLDLTINERDVQKLHGLMAGLAADIEGFGTAVGYDRTAPKPPPPPKPLADVFREVRDRSVKAELGLTDGTYWQGQSTSWVTSAGDGGTKVELNTNHHGGHQYIGAAAIKTNEAGQITTYGARVNPMSWGQREEWPLHGTFDVRKYDSDGQEIYRFVTNRRGAGEKLARLTLKHIAAHLPQPESTEE